MLQRLDYDAGKEGDQERARKQLDHELKVRRWRITPDDEDPYQDVPKEEGAPWWWDGAEEASASFLEAQGIQLD